jgi:hypothetical protein
MKLQQVLVPFVILSCTALAPAQREDNDFTGALTSLCRTPDPSRPFAVLVGSGSVHIEVSGIAGAPYALVAGSYRGAGTPYGVLGGQVINLDLLAPLIVVGDGIGGSGGLLPPSSCVVDVTGSSQLAFFAGALPPGMRFAFQAVTIDPALPFGLNLTAAAEFEISSIVAMDLVPHLVPTSPGVAAADEGLYTHTFVGQGYNFYGQSVTQITISTNGWLRFDGAATQAEANPQAARFELGTVGMAAGPAVNAPIVAPLWDDLDFGSQNARIDLVEDPAARTVTVLFDGGRYANPSSSVFGSFSVALRFSSLSPVVTFDYSGFGFGRGQALVGLSDGNVGAGGASVQHDFVQFSSSHVYVSAGDYDTVYQDFAGSSLAAPSQPEDMGGLTLTFADTSIDGVGHWLYF